jgi:PAS domain S-box-containing protein
MAEGISVLHVDDDRQFAEVTAEFLERAGDGIAVTTETAPSGALDRLRTDSASIDCVVSDYDMPGMDGLELLEVVHGEWPAMPFILFTGKGSEGIAAEAISAGVTDYIRKEMETDTYDVLAHRVRNAVERARAREETARTRRFLEKVVERATDMIAVVDTNREVVFLSGSVEAILGYTPAEVKDLGPFELVHPDDRTMLEEQFEARLNDPDRQTGISHRVRHKDGHYVRVRARGYNLVDDPDVEGVLIYTRRVDSDEVT